MDQVDIAIIGAGVVGLAVTAELAGRFKEASIVLLEKNDTFGLETSSRNSEVIHAGIYYPTGSLKATLCVEGKYMLYRFCREQQVNHRRIGKLIIAGNREDIPHLEALLAQAAQNGVTDLEYLEKPQIAALEPHIRAEAALYSPSTGIIDTHQLMARLEWLAAQAGALIAYRHEVTGLTPRGDGFEIHYRNPDGSADALRCRRLINCAGLTADKIAGMAGIDVEAAGYRIIPCKGEYFSVPSSKAKMVSRLVYPPPLAELVGLGIHVTKTLDGRLRLGPSAVYTDKLDYSVNPAQAAVFYAAVRGFLPFLDPEDLEPEMAGIRPKLQGLGEPFRDFIVRCEADRGLPGMINLIGVEAPGLTACLAIARMVGGLVAGCL